MQVLNEQKRLKIIAAAAELFATQPFHKVLLSEVAEAAGVGKGTVYTYFKGKEDLYVSVLFAGFSDLVARLETQINEDMHSPTEILQAIVREIVGFACQNPYHFEVMRTVGVRQFIDHTRWREKRRELTQLIESVIRKGIDQGVFRDLHPELTARLIPGCVRSLTVDGIDAAEAPVLRDHILRFVLAALQPGGGTQ